MKYRWNIDQWVRMNLCWQDVSEEIARSASIGPVGASYNKSTFATQRQKQKILVPTIHCKQYQYTTKTLGGHELMILGTVYGGGTIFCRVIVSIHRWYVVLVDGVRKLEEVGAAGINKQQTIAWFQYSMYYMWWLRAGLAWINVFNAVWLDWCDW